MILTIDIGNTNQTFSVFNEVEEILLKGDLDHLKSDLAEKEISWHKLKAIVSSVNDSYTSNIEGEFIGVRNFFKQGNFLDMPVHYSETIGDDRLICAYYVYKMASEPCIVIDSGTFTTIDLITEQGFQGGHILPGLNAIAATYDQGKNLKSKSFVYQNKTNFSIDSKPPINTELAIEQGILSSFYYPIAKIIKDYGHKNIFITGGNANLLRNYLNKSHPHFVLTLERDLVHKSLLFIAREVH